MKNILLDDKWRNILTSISIYQSKSEDDMNYNEYLVVEEFLENDDLDWISIVRWGESVCWQHWSLLLQELDQRLCVSLKTCQSPKEPHHPSTTDVSGFLLKSFYSEALVNEVLGLWLDFIKQLWQDSKCSLENLLF